MPGDKPMRHATSAAQQRFMGAELARKRAGESTETGMSEAQLKEFASAKSSKLPERKEEKKHEGRGFGKDMRSHHGRHAKPRGG